MLVLTRKSQQSVVVGREVQVRVTVLAVDGDQVRLGFDAAKDIPIAREEILFRIPKEVLEKPEIKPIH